MSRYLLDANALIALVVREHEHHERVAAWTAAVDELALCPVVEGALVRFLVRSGETARTAQALLRAFYAAPRAQFWQDSVSYDAAPLQHVRGHRQVTDAYLVALAQHHDARLATLDAALAKDLPAGTVLISA